MTFNDRFSSRRNIECKSIKVTLHEVGNQLAAGSELRANVHFRDDEYTSRFFTVPNNKSSVCFDFNARFVPDDLLRNELELLFQEPLSITLLSKEGKKIVVFKMSLMPLICRKNINVNLVAFSTYLKKKLYARVESRWELSFDRNNRHHAKLRIFSNDDFHAIQNIGVGRDGTFELVKNEKTGEIFAKKTLNNDRLKSLNSGEDKESDALITFDHPSILHIIGFINRNFLKKQKSAIIMDYIPNGSLISILKNENLAPPGWNPTKKSIVIYGIAFGLQLLHSNGLMHSDLRTSSILLDENLEPRIGDIGLTRHDNDDLEVHDLIFKAPEVLLRKPYDYSADVYSFGMILYHIYTSHYPFENLTAPEIIFNVMHGITPKLPLGTPKHIKNLIHSCISYDPKERPLLKDLVKKRDAFMFLGTDRNEFESFCDRISQRITEPNEESAIKRITASAKKGSSYSQYIYGLLMKHETSVSDYFKLSADQNIGGAEYNYGIMLFEGIEVAKDRFEAVKYFLKAAQKGNDKAALNVGLMFAEGKYLPKNDIEAYKFFNYAANKGNPKAQVNLGLMYMSGRVVRRNEAEAIKYYKMAAQQDDPQAQYNLAIVLSKGKHSLSNMSEIIRYFKNASEQGLAKAQFSMGLILLEGKGVKQNEGEASYYFKLAADAGLPSAQLNLGLMMLRGQGVAKDIVTAIKYLKLAAQNGDNNAQLLLGMICLKGKNGVKKDIVKAAKYLGDAAAGGNTKAMVNIGMMFLKGTGVPKDEAIAVKCFKVAAAKGNQKAKFNLATLAKK